MHVRSLLAAALISSPAGAVETVPFHTATLSESSSVSLSLLADTISTDADYDFDVVIGISELANDGTVSYQDPGAHRARVRCGVPAKVFVGGADYPVGTLASSSRRGDWRESLWQTLCSSPPLS